MNKIIFLLIALLPLGLSAQDRYFTKAGTISFDATSDQSPEEVIGRNRTASAVLDTKTGNLLFVVLMKGFEFKKALMQEHFNENYVESDKFPKAEFKGQVANMQTVDISKDGSYPVQVKGTLTLHGKSNPVDTRGTLTVKNGKIASNATFQVSLKDFDITVPTLVADKVARVARITVDCILEPFKG